MSVAIMARGSQDGLLRLSVEKFVRCLAASD